MAATAIAPTRLDGAPLGVNVGGGDAARRRHHPANFEHSSQFLNLSRSLKLNRI